MLLIQPVFGRDLESLVVFAEFPIGKCTSPFHKLLQKIPQSGRERVHLSRNR